MKWYELYPVDTEIVVIWPEGGAVSHDGYQLCDNVMAGG